MIHFRRTSCGRSVRTYDCIRRRSRPPRWDGMGAVCIAVLIALLALCAPVWCVCLLCLAALLLLWRLLNERR